mgnify:CR=1 FL=1
MGYQCKNCNFKTEIRMNNCLNCGRVDSIEKDKEAKELVEEVDRFLG